LEKYFLSLVSIDVEGRETLGIGDSITASNAKGDDKYFLINARTKMINK
jgi:hypothetical protein